MVEDKEEGLLRRTPIIGEMIIEAELRGELKAITEPLKGLVIPPRRHMRLVHLGRQLSVCTLFDGDRSSDLRGQRGRGAVRRDRLSSKARQAPAGAGSGRSEGAVVRGRPAGRRGLAAGVVRSVRRASLPRPSSSSTARDRVWISANDRGRLRACSSCTALLE